jgi:lysophospholipase L1-like esterase
MKAFLLSLGALVFLVSVNAEATSPEPELAAEAPLNPALPTIFIAGDSTAASYKSNGIQVQGWGLPFANYFDSHKVNVAIRAVPGRSSRTFITDGLWDRLLTEVKPGDTVLIQFGHNDQGPINGEPAHVADYPNWPQRASGSLPGIGEESLQIVNVLSTQPETVHTFGWYIRKMIDDTRRKGATPIVLTRTLWNIWNEGVVKRGDVYREWDHELAKEEGVSFLDLNDAVADHYQALGQARVASLYLADRAHFTAAGAYLQAATTLDALEQIPNSPFASLLSARSVKAAQTWTDKVLQLTSNDAKMPVSRDTVLFIGSSSIEYWGTLVEDFPGIMSLERGIAGSGSGDALFLADWIVTPYHPRIVVVYTGENDIAAGVSPETVRDDIRGFRKKIHGALPETRIIYLSIKQSPARRVFREQILSTNRLIAADCASDPQCTFLDVATALLDSKGRPRLELYREDHLHLSRKGYAMWANLLAPYLKAPAQ